MKNSEFYWPLFQWMYEFLTNLIVTGDQVVWHVYGSPTQKIWWLSYAHKSEQLARKELEYFTVIYLVMMEQ